MTPLIPGTARMLLSLFALAMIVLAILGIFKSSIYNRLSVRIIALIFATGLVTLSISYVFDEPFFSIQHPLRWHLAQISLVVLGGPVVLGLLAARFVQRPLRQFKSAVASLEQNNYKVQLQPTGITEFDEVFSKFNHLINRLEHEEKLRKELLSDASHELNTPLTTMIGQLTAIDEGKYRATKERVAILREQAERLAELVQQLDAYTKARVPGTAKPEKIELLETCQRLVSRFSPELADKHIAVRLDIPADFTLHASDDAVQRIMTNLIQNTLRYSGASELTISADTGRIVFSDNGKGVPAASLPHLFERFYRADKSRSRSTGGLGLGLAIVKELTEQQGWQIRASAANPGLAFVITL